MQYSQGNIGRVFVLRLEDGDRVPDCIETFAREHGVACGLCTLIGGIGSGKLVTGPEDGQAQSITPILTDINDVHEVAALGTIFPDSEDVPRLHMHGALGRDGRTRTGCVRPGLDIWRLGEVVLIELTGLDMKRMLDPAFGFEVLMKASGR